jgi:predicted transcriptional regulator
MRKPRYTIVLPPAVGRRVHRAARRENRAPSDLAVDALRLYFSRQRIPTEVPTEAELRAIQRGEEDFRRGDYITLDEYCRSVGSAPRRVRKKVS